MTFQSQVVSDNSATSDMEDSEDPSTSDSESESDRLEDEVICLKSENMTLKERILELQKDLVISRVCHLLIFHLFHVPTSAKFRMSCIVVTIL